MIKRVNESKKIIKTIKIFSFLVQLILYLILAFSALTFVTSKTPILGSIRSMVVLSGSMEPALPVGSVVFVRKELGYSVNDIITYQTNEGMNITHRITNFDFTEDGTVYYSKGDANDSPDSKAILSSQIVGRVFFTMPNFGKIISFLNSPKGFFLFIIGPSIIFITLELWNIKKEIENEVERKILARLENLNA